MHESMIMPMNQTKTPQNEENAGNSRLLYVCLPQVQRCLQGKHITHKSY